MPDIPAMCDQCGAVFASGFSLSNVRNMSMTNNTVRCPRCGGTGRIPDGLYDVIGETIQIAATSAKSAEGLTRLKRLLEDVRRTGADPATVARRIEDEAPEFRGLAAAASKRTSADLLPWIVVVLQVVQLLIGSFHDVLEPRQNVTPELIEQIYRKVLDTDTRTAPDADRSREHVGSTHTGRNEPCPCGSGKKYKRCHGR